MSYSSFTRSNSSEDDASYVYVYEEDSSEDEEELKTPQTPQQIIIEEERARTPSPLTVRSHQRRISRSYPTKVETLEPFKYNYNTQSWEKQNTESIVTTGTKTVDQLTIVTYNIWFENIYFDLRTAALIKILEQTNSDVICLQEVKPAFLEKLVEQEWVRRNYSLSDAEGSTLKPYGILILSKFPIKNCKLYHLQTKMKRKVLICDLFINGERNRMSTVHLESLDNKTIRRYQLSTIFPLLSSDDTANIWLSGDFNFCATSEEEKHNISRDYKDIWEQLRPEDVGHTIGINFPQQVYKPARYDRMLYHSSSWKPQSVDMIGMDSIATFSADDHVYPSDHAGIVGTFVFRRNGKAELEVPM